MKRFVSVLLLLVFSVSLSSCYFAHSLKEAPVIPDVDKVKIDVPPSVEATADTPEKAIADFAADTLKTLYEGDRNVLISPVSISLALGLTAGGARGDTLSQLESVLGRGVSIEDMTAFYSQLSDKLDESESVDVEVANSIWIKDDKKMISVNPEFIDFADQSFDAEVYTEPFNNSTVKKINGWVNENTDGMIKDIIDEIDYETVMYLINALSFDGEWQREYTDTSEHFKFKNVAGKTETVTGMYSDESIYISDTDTTGFIKNYKGGEYGFAVFLPNEDVNINDYVKSFSGDKYYNLLNNKQTVAVSAKLPKFSFEYSSLLNDSLASMGATHMFKPSLADLSGIGDSSMGNLYVNRVIHKTYIEVAEKGTKAAAVTAVEVNCESEAMPPREIKYVTVDRPFVFAIIDNQSGIPIFMGVVLSVG